MSLPSIYPVFQHWAKQTVWIYSDPHFSDEDLECGIYNRPSDEEHIKKINACAGRKDTLIILGDVGNVECIRKLRAGRKVLIMGNHDVGRTKYERKIIKEIYDQDKFTKEEAIADMRIKYPSWKIWADENYDFHSPFIRWEVYADNGLFDEVYAGALIVGEKLIFSHEPINLPYFFNIHGHVHNKSAKGDARHLNVCSDVIGYKPLNLNIILKNSGLLAKVESIHRIAINKAIVRKQKKEKKYANK